MILNFCDKTNRRFENIEFITQPCSQKIWIYLYQQIPNFLEHIIISIPDEGIMCYLVKKVINKL